jgi:uncharacterized membrane protein
MRISQVLKIMVVAFLALAISGVLILLVLNAQMGYSETQNCDADGSIAPPTRSVSATGGDFTGDVIVGNVTGTCY